MSAVPDARAGDTQAEELAGSLRTVVGRLSHRFRGVAAARGITPTRLSALVALSKVGPMRPSDLATSLGITPASTSRLVEALESEGWVARTADPSDGRAFLLSVSDAGSGVLAGLRREADGKLADAVRALTPDERRALADALPVLAAIADRYLAESSVPPR
ncbi:MAG TPA: MarR family transcriptional regulator [Demequinaceae bacterium]